ncbi:MAG: hypothetical protein LUC26_05565 [Prevotella sp.]|nr:hypothetical protein [Prevotella sp.]
MANLHDFAFYIFLLAAIVVAVVIVKKVAGCLVRTLLILATVALLAYIYLHFFAAG